MDPNTFTSKAFGEVKADRLGSWGHGFYLPKPIDPGFQPSETVSALVSKAELALGKLAGASIDQQLITPLLLPAMANEALESSRIEGTQATLVEVLDSELAINDDIEEVRNYIAASNEALELMQEFPLSQRVLKQIHKTLLQGVRGTGKTPGQFRTSPVWLGAAGLGPERASFIPPLPEYLPGLISDLELFINQPSNQPLVLRLALVHYQFETIHPFLDGNGRIGRLLVGLQLVAEKLMQQPVLFLSPYLYAHRSEYYTRLQLVQTVGDMDGFVEFFAKAVLHSATNTIDQVIELSKLRTSYLELAQNTNEQKLVQLIFSNPLVSVKLVQNQLGISQPTASKLIRALEAKEILKSRGQSGKGRKETWYAPKIWLQHSAELPS